MSFDDFRKELVEAGELDSAEAEKLDLMELISIYQKFKIRQATGGASRPSSLRAELMKTSVRKKTAKPRATKAPKKETEAPKKRSKPSQPREGLVYALEKLTTIAKGGNYCMTVVDGCWVNFRYKKRGNHLYFQVAGDKYIPKRSHFKKEHIEILKEMGYYHRGEESFASLKPGARTWRGFFPFSGNSSILGLGLGAVSWAWGSARYQNLDGLSRYSQRISAGRLPVDDGCRVTLRQEMIHFILSGLECGWVSCREFKSVFGESVNLRFASHFRRLTACGVLIRRGDCYKLTDHPKAAFIYSKMFYEPVVAQRCLNK